MITVACVLRSGGDYGPSWVYALRRGLNRHHPEHRFVCLTDVQGVTPMWRAPLEHHWPGWWSKLELFRPGLFEEGERVLYLDLDTLVLGSLEELASYRGEFAMIRGFYRKTQLQSGVMAFTPGEVTQALWDRWMRSPQRGMRQKRGDGEWIAENAPRADVLPDLYPGAIRSFKVHHRDQPPDPDQGVALLCGHGHPRFSDPVAGWAHRHWVNQ